MLMTPEDAWGQVLYQLKLDMPPVTYETWVRPAFLVAYCEDGSRFVIGIPDENGCAWLEKRMETRIRQILSGCMGSDSAVEFVVSDPETVLHISPAGTADAHLEDTERLAVESIQDKAAGVETGDTITVFDAPRSLYNAIVQPEKIVSMPRYLLRFLPLVGSEPFLVQMAFRQMRFLKTEEGKRHYSFEARIEDLLKWASWTSRASFRRYLGQPELGWFGIEQIPQEGRAIDPVTGSARQKPNRYRMQIDIPITPMDADTLRSALSEGDIRQDPVNALRRALKLPVEQLRPERPFPMPTPAHRAQLPRVILVEDVAREMIGNAGQDPETRKEFKRLSEQLANKITRPNESIQASWYFVQNWMGELGKADLSMFIFLMRSLCFTSPSEKRDTVWIEGGYEEIAGMLGITYVRKVATWLPRFSSSGPQKKDQQADHTREKADMEERDTLNLDQFVRRVGRRLNATGRHAFEFRVRSGNEPLIPVDQIIYDLALINEVREVLVEKQIKPPSWRDLDTQTRKKFRDDVRGVLIERGQIQDANRQAQMISDALSGVGILDQLLRDPYVEEIFVRGGEVAVEYDGTFYYLGKLADDKYFEDLATHVADQGGATLRGDRPAVLVDLPGGERFTAIVPRLSIQGTAINVRTFGRRVRTLEEMEGTGTFSRRRVALSGSLEDIQDPTTRARVASLTSETDRFLAWLVATTTGSLLIAGEMGSGKTTLMNALSGFMPKNAPVAVLETFRELDVQHPFLLRTVAPSELPEGQPGVTLDWVLNVIYTRMNPSVILVGEVVAREALQFLKATCLGRKAITTIHGGSVEEALVRLEQLALASAPELGLAAVRSMVALGVNVIALMGRVAHGNRVERTLQAIAAIEGLDEHGNYRLRYLYRLEGARDVSVLADAFQRITEGMPA